MGIESGAGIWGYIFLTGGRGLGHDVAGVTISAYWAMIFVGRAIFGRRAGRRRGGLYPPLSRLAGPRVAMAAAGP